MGIKETLHDGQIEYHVKVCARSRRNPRIKIQKEASRLKSWAEAKRAEKELLRAAHEKVLLKEAEGDSWQQLISDWEEALRSGRGIDRKVQSITIDDNVRALEIYTSHWMSRPASSITRADIREVLEQIRLDGKSFSRAKAIKHAINGVFKWGIETGHVKGLSQSPAQGLKVGVERQERRPDILNIHEIRNLLKVARTERHPWYPVWAMALLTGMRSGELIALTWTDVDFENQRLLVTKSFNNRLNVTKSTKSGQWREVPINEDLQRLLKELKVQRGNQSYVLPRLQGWERGEAARVLRAFCEGIGITSVKFHALRACFATHLLRDGIAPVKVMKICGWQDLKTMQHYVRLAGVEIADTTKTLKVLPEAEVMAKVVQIFAGHE